MSNEQPKNDPATPQGEDRKKTFARRALIQAGWAIPAAAMISVPRAAKAASAHNDGTPGGHLDDALGPHTDIPGHNDFSHFDSHLDNGVPHNDRAPHADGIPGHSDSSPHSDGVPAAPSHVDHGDNVHSDNNFPPSHADLPAAP